ncbi:hypothetical protein JCM8097_004588 [Rhodosporidiobolus ruineniae]
MLQVHSPERLGSSYVSLGIWGGCVVNANAPDQCTRARIRYRPSVIVSDALGVRVSGVVNGVTGGLLLAPICCGLAFIAFLVAFFSYFAGFICAAFLAGWVFLATLVLVIVQSTVFCTLEGNINHIPGVHANLDAGFWCTIAALPVLLVATCCTFAACFSDRREHRGYF